MRRWRGTCAYPSVGKRSFNLTVIAGGLITFGQRGRGCQKTKGGCAISLMAFATRQLTTDRAARARKPHVHPYLYQERVNCSGKIQQTLLRIQSGSIGKVTLGPVSMIGSIIALSTHTIPYYVDPLQVRVAADRVRDKVLI